MTINNQESVTIVYFGEINRAGYEKLTKECEALGETYPQKADLVLSTLGGDPDAGFRIARCLQHHFEDGINLYVPHYCKSAGTLIAIGAKELILSDGGELGPLDVQLVKSDEMFERSSGMDITQGFNVLTTQAAQMFNMMTVQFKMQTRLSTKIATEAASQITVGTFAPIFAQIDPVRVGEIERATAIAFKYGELLSEKYDNIQPNGVAQLVAGYPSHSFVIDRKEAKNIFKEVRSPNDDEKNRLRILDNIMKARVASSEVLCEVVDLENLGVDNYDASDDGEESQELETSNNDIQNSKKSNEGSNSSKQRKK